MADILMKSGAYGTTEHGHISYKTAGHCSRRFLANGRNRLILDRFAQIEPIPKNKSTTITFRRWNELDLATTPLTEGVTSDAISATYKDIKCQIKQYGSVMKFTDVIQDTYEDPVLNTFVKLASEQAAATLETLHFNALMGGTNVFYTGGVTSRAEVKDKISITDFRKVARAFQKSKASFITDIVKATPNIGTEPVGQSFIAICHTDLETDIRNIQNFIPVEQYGSSMKAMQYELGKIENFRILMSQFFNPWVSAGASTTGVLANGLPVTTAAKCDVYPILCLARDAYAITPLAGKHAVHISVFNPVPSKEDPQGLIGKLAWKVWDATCILNEAWMARIECACGDLSA